MIPDALIQSLVWNFNTGIEFNVIPQHGLDLICNRIRTQEAQLMAKLDKQS